ncbi:MAG: hypothetical protein HKN26_09460 [Acidimicrobiales bacterium]|nr:hypothetical protein [Acidimicrobiales bacterium]
MTALRWLLASVLVIVIAIVVLVGVDRRRTTAPLPSSATVIELSGPVESVAGEPISMTLRTSETVSVAVLSVRSGPSLHTLTVPVTEGRGVAPLPTAAVATAGRLTVMTASGIVHEIDIAPAEIVAPINPLVGPHSIVADGADRTLAIVLPRDRFGNAVADGTVVNFRRDRLSDSVPLDTAATETAGGIAWQFFTAGTEAGTSDVWASAAGQDGPVVSFEEVPGRAAAVDVRPLAATPTADGRSVVSISTEPIADAFGNLVLDGTEGHFRIGSAAGVSMVPGVVVSGRLRAEWTVPAQPGRVSLVAEVHGRTSSIEWVWFATAVADVPTSVRAHPDGVEVRIGPVRNADGAFVADGTTVEIGARKVALHDGVAQLVLTGDQPETLAVRVLGFEQHIDVGKERVHDR